MSTKIVTTTSVTTIVDDVITAVTASSTIEDGSTQFLARSSPVIGTSILDSVPVPLSSALPFLVESDVTQVRLRISNKDVKNNANGPSISGVKLCLYTSAGSMNGAVTGDAFGEDDSVTIPGDGTEFVTDWIDITGKLGTDSCLVLAYSVPTGQNLAISTDITLGKRSQTSAAVNPLPSDMATCWSYPFTVRVERMTGARRIIGLGTSITARYDATHESGGNQLNGYLQLLSVNKGYATDDMGITGSTLANFNDQASFTAGMLPDGADAIVELSVNSLPDLSGDNNTERVTDFMSQVSALVTTLTTAGVVNVYWVNLPPTLSYVAYDPLRLLVNAALLTLFGSGKIIDASAVLTDPDDTDAQLASLTTDGTHPNTAGNALLYTEAESKVG